MRINKLTITGADNSVGVDTLRVASILFPFIEWGILFSSQLRPRYPTKSYVDDLSQHSDLNLSAHFCGWYANEVLEQKNYELITRLSPNFKRVQLNYNFGKSSRYNLDGLFNFANSYSEKDIILQYNKSNAETLNHFVAINILPRNIHFLHDSSGGRGTVIERILPTIGNQYTGYAGGLNPDNIESICDMISGDEDDFEVWIDLESGVRTEDQFDVDKMCRILQSVVKYIK